jgi:NDP-sugar pyrophosphorylase family protein
MSKRAVILAGGMGARLRPYTVVLPKPLMPLGEFPILEVIIRQLAHYGFEEVTLAVNHQANIIKAFCGVGERWGVRIGYSLETKPLSTMAPLRLLEDLPQNFLLLNGDVLTDLDFGGFYARHVAAERLFTVGSATRRHRVDYGVLDVDSDDRLVGFHEKPETTYFVSMGVYVLNRAVLDFIPRDTRYGFDDLMLDLLRRGQHVHVERHPGYWLDIGRPDDYMQAIEEFEERRRQLLPHA